MKMEVMPSSLKLEQNADKTIRCFKLDSSMSLIFRGKGRELPEYPDLQRATAVQRQHFSPNNCMTGASTPQMCSKRAKNKPRIKR